MLNLRTLIRKIGILCLVILGFNSCRKDVTTSDFLFCKPVYLDSISRSDTVNSVYVYREIPSLFVYKNRYGDSLKFRMTYQFDAEEEQRSLEKVCESDEKQIQQHYVNGWHNHRTYSSLGTNRNIQIDYHMATEYFLLDRFLWYELMRINIHFDGAAPVHNIEMSFALDLATAGPHVDFPETNYYYEVLIDNEWYVDVYTVGEATIAYSHELGVIAFLDEFGEQWVLDRSE